MNMTYSPGFRRQLLDALTHSGPGYDLAHDAGQQRVEALVEKIRSWAFNYGVEDMPQAVMDELNRILTEAVEK